jgi:hypothetical protein
VIPAELQLPLTPTIDKPPKTQKTGKHTAQKHEFTRKRIGQNEVDYVMDDITIPQFGPISEAKELSEPEVGHERWHAAIVK